MLNILVFTALSFGTSPTTGENTPLFASQGIAHSIAFADSVEYRDYYGNYKMKDNEYIPKVKVYFKNGDLVALAGDYPETKLSKKQEDEFEELNYGAKVIFVRKDGQIVGIKVIVQGQELVGDKEI